MQTDEFWDEADIFDYEMVRIALRDLIKYLEKINQEDYYTNFKDEIIDVVKNTGEYSVNDMKSYRKRINHYLKQHKDDLVVYKLRNNKVLTKDDVKHLEKILWQDLGTIEEYQSEFGNEPLLKFVVNIVGLDKKAANEAFSKFLSDES